MMKGLPADVYRAARRFTGAGGARQLTDMVAGVTVVDPAVGEVFDASPEQPPVRLRRRLIGGRVYVSADALNRPAGVGMFGGNFIFTSDSRLRDVSDQPIPVHDRVESAPGEGLSVYELVRGAGERVLCVYHGAQVPQAIWMNYAAASDPRSCVTCDHEAKAAAEAGQGGIEGAL